MTVLTGDPERDPWPSCEEKPDNDACPYCEAMPDEAHVATCPLGEEIDADDIKFCDGCGVAYSTCCECDDERGR